MRNLLRRLLGRNAVFLATCMAVLFGFELALCAMVASLDIQGAMGQVMAFAPPLLRAMMEQYLVGGSPAGVIAFGWNHPIAHAVLAAVAIALGARAFGLEPFAASRLSALFLNALLLQAAIHALTMLASSFGREAGRVALIGVLAAVLSFLVNTLATLWSKAAFASPYSLHGYFDPRAILVDRGLDPASIAVLAGFTVAATALAFWRFSRRDLP